jgi:hypothetical protein
MRASIHAALKLAPSLSPMSYSPHAQVPLMAIHQGVDVVEIHALNVLPGALTGH